MNFIKRYGMVSGVIAICFCVVVYVVFTTHSIFTISRQINYVAEHPYKAMSEINKIRARVLEMNTYLPIFISENENNLDGIRSVLRTSCQENEKSLKILDEIYLGNKETYDFGGKKVLLVEDNELNMEIASELLKFVNLQVEHAENGKVAVDIFRNSKEKEYALIFMDIQMPLMNGYDAARCIRSSEHPAARTIPIIAMTANAFNDDVQAAFDAGMNGHLAKPIDVEVLYKTIARYI
ncbi:response regulator [Phascolarctobacterium faecium]|uniref:response regulator n=1 Tax=Phascolarctobacterium faecium TaxID=33025 RepID=UPI002FDD14B4